MKKLITIFLFFIFGCSSTTNKNKETKEISIISLISNPKDYHLKKIKIEGYFVYANEGNAIYLNKSDYENMIFKNAIYLYINQSNLDENEIKPPYKGYVSIEGYFNMKKLGSYNLFSGTIDTVLRIDRLYKKDSDTEEFNMH